MAPLIVVQAWKRSFLFGFQFINKERIMDVTGPVGVKVKTILEHSRWNETEMQF